MMTQRYAAHEERGQLCCAKSQWEHLGQGTLGMSSSAAKLFAARRGVLSRNGPLIMGLVVAVYAAILLVERAVRSDAPAHGSPAPMRRKLYEYEAGTCDGYIETNYFFFTVALLCWGIFFC